MTEHHELMGGRLHLYQRENSRFWQCATYLGGRNHRNTTKTESLAQAKDIAEDWYLELKGKARAGELRHGKTFKFAAEKFQIEHEAITAGEAKPQVCERPRRSPPCSPPPLFRPQGGLRDHPRPGAGVPGPSRDLVQAPQDRRAASTIPISASD